MFENTENSESIHISSLVIYVSPEKLNFIISALTKLRGLEVAAHDSSGKLVAVLETESENGILSTIDHINSLSGVLTTTMVYHELDC